MLKLSPIVCFALLASLANLAFAQQPADQPVVQPAPYSWTQHNRYAELNTGTESLASWRGFAGSTS